MKEFLQINLDGFKWELVQDFQPDLKRVLAAGAAGTVVKETPSKLVTSCEHEGKVYFTKHYRHAAVPMRSLKFYFKPSQSRQEWELARKLTKLDIPIVRHVAFGERWEGAGLKESVLITEGFPGVPVRQAGPDFASQVLEVIQAMHCVGAMQTDLHGQNILVRTDVGEVRLVDLHGIVIKERLTNEEIEENLALVRKFLPIDVPDHIRRRGQEIRKKNNARRARRALRENKDFQRRRLGGLNWQLRQNLVTPRVEEILKDPDGFLKTQAHLRKRGRSSTVGLADGLVLKRYNFKKAANLVKDRFRYSRAVRAFRKCYHMELVGIPTAPAIAAANRMVLGFPKISYLLMQEIPGAVELKEAREVDITLVAKVAELLACMHGEGFSHRDLKTTNILLDSNREPYLIDLEGLEYTGEVSLKRMRSDLARLARSARLHPEYQGRHFRAFIRTYCKARGIGNLTAG